MLISSDSTAHVKTICALFKRLRKHYLKVPPSKARLSATDADCLGHSIPPAGVPSNVEKLSTLMEMLMPRNLKQLCALMGGVGYFHRFLLDLSR